MESDFVFEQLVTPQLFIQISKMQKFREFTEDRAWNIDINTAMLNVEGIGQFPIRMVGSSSFDTSDFLWAWANESSGIDRNSVAFEAVDRIHSYGTQQQVALLTTPLVKFEPGYSPAELFAMLVSYGYGEDYVTYAAPFNEGRSVFYLIAQIEQAATDKSEDVRFINSIFNKAIECAINYNVLTGGGRIDLKKSYIHYLEYLGREAYVVEDSVEIADASGKLTVRFTPEGLVQDIIANIHPLPENV